MPRRINTYRPPGYIPPAARRKQYEQADSRRDDIAFYQSPAWTKLRLAKLRENPLCERCRREQRITAATHVHHVLERKDRPDLALDWDNLEALCSPCHSRHHASQKRS